MVVKVCLGGTFNVLHGGHIALLSRAFAEGDEVFVGLTSDAMAGKGRKVRVRPYEERLRDLEGALARLSGGKQFHVFEIDDEFGPAATGDFDVIVVSEETAGAAERINRAREEAGLRPLRIAAIGMVLDAEGKRLSSTRLIGRGRGKDNS